VACGSPSRGRGAKEWNGREGKERKTAVMIAWVLERKGSLLLWDSGVWSEVVLCSGEENSVAFSPPFLMAAAGEGREGDRGSR